MAYEFDEVKQSQEIFAALLENREIKEQSREQKLFDAYMGSAQIQDLVKSQCAAVGCSCICYGNVIYLIPDQDNTWLGYSKTDLKRRLCRGNPSEVDYYLVQFSILCLLLEFYDEHGSEHKIREFIRFGDLLNRIGERLEEGSKRYSEQEQEAAGLIFKDMNARYSSMNMGSDSDRVKTTKIGFLKNLLGFFEEQDLVMVTDNGEFIRTTHKLDHFMDWNLLNTENLPRVLRVLEQG